jgi:hypothetical protein
MNPFSMFRRKATALAPEPAWETMTLDQITRVLATPDQQQSGRSMIALIQRLYEIAFSTSFSAQDCANAARLAAAVEKDFVAANPESAKATAEARESVWQVGLRTAFVRELELAANKLGATVGAPLMRDILTRLDVHKREGFVAAVDKAMADNWTPERSAPAILFNLLSMIGENAACERLLETRQ